MFLAIHTGNEMVHLNFFGMFLIQIVTMAQLPIKAIAKAVYTTTF